MGKNNSEPGNNVLSHKKKSWFDKFIEYKAKKAGKECSISHSHFTTSAREMLYLYKDKVIEAARLNNIDGRAIAAAIVWEYEQNRKGRWSDYLQVIFPTQNMGIGWGSIHDRTLSVSVPQNLFLSEDTICLRLEAESGIEKVAKIMAIYAKIVFKKTNGVWINDCPPVLAYYFNTGAIDGIATKHIAIPGNQLSEKFIISKEKMSKWIAQNLDDFVKFKTKPKPPKGFYVRATVDINVFKK